MRMIRHEPASIEADIETACRFLAEWPGVTTVWLFGSAANGHELDLVRWEDAGPVLRDQIQRWGRVLYER